MSPPAKVKDGSNDQPALTLDTGSPNTGSGQPSLLYSSPTVSEEKASGPLPRKCSDRTSKASSASPRVSPPEEATKAQKAPSPGAGTKGSLGKRQRTPDSVVNKGTGAKDSASKRSVGVAVNGKTPSPVSAKEQDQAPESTSPEGRRPKFKLRMPDGTRVGPEDKNRYIRAMQKEHLQCDYTPFLIISAAGFAMVTGMYLFIYHPDLWVDVTRKLRLLIGIPDDSEEPQRIPDTSTPVTEITTAEAFNASDSTSSKATTTYIQKANTLTP